MIGVLLVFLLLLIGMALGVGLYKIDGIPYNVLLDPSGKILATSLRGDDLEQMLQKTLP
mgnify:CR=1 FL=1